MIPLVPPTNRLAMISFSLAWLTIISFCIGLAPIPLTAWICYPVALLFGSAGILTGFQALGGIRRSGEKGRSLALIGIWTGSAIILAILILTIITVILIYFGAGFINTIWTNFQR